MIENVMTKETIKKKITPEFIADIAAMLIREYKYDSLKNYQYFLNKNSDDLYEICFGIKDYYKRFEKTKIFKNILIPEFIDISELEDEIDYVTNINLQIIQQSCLLDTPNKPIEFLGNFNGRGGIKKGDIKIVLNYLDLYDIYFKDEKKYEDIYFNELVYIIDELEDRG